MSPEQAQAKLEERSAEFNRVLNDYEELTARIEHLERDLKECKRMESDGYARRDACRRERLRLLHLISGKCSSHIRSGERFQRYTLDCDKPGKHACEKCGARSCGVHVKGHRREA